MLRKLISRPFEYLPSARTHEIKKYLCVRMAQSPSNSASIQSFKALQSQYKLTPEQLTSLISFLRLNPGGYRKYLSHSQFEVKSEDWLREYRYSDWYDPNQALEDRQRQLSQQYPDVVKEIDSQTDRASLLREIEPVFFDKGARPSSVGGLPLKKIEEKLEAHVQGLRSRGQYTTEVEETANEILDAFRLNYEGSLLDLRVLIDTYNQPLSKDLTVKKAAKSGDALVESGSDWTSSGLSVKDLQELDNLENAEFSLFLQESNREVIAERHSVALAEWVNDRKLVFESVPLDFDTSARNGAILGLVGYLAIGGFLYVLYKGDAKFTTFVALPVVALLGLRQGGRSLRAANLNYLQRVWVHKDGKHLDLQLSSFNGSKIVKDVPIKDFKLFREGKAVVDAEKIGLKGVKDLTLGKLRFNHEVLVPSDYFEAGQVGGLLPTGSQAQKFVWENVLKGVEIDAKLA